MLCASVYLFSFHANTQRPKNPIGKIFTETRREKTLVFCCSIVLDVTFRRIFCIYYLHLAFGCCNHILIYFIQNERRCVYTTKCYYAKCLFWNLCIQIWLKPVAYQRTLTEYRLHNLSQSEEQRKKTARSVLFCLKRHASLSVPCIHSILFITRLLTVSSQWNSCIGAVETYVLASCTRIRHFLFGAIQNEAIHKCEWKCAQSHSYALA